MEPEVTGILILVVWLVTTGTSLCCMSWLCERYESRRERRRGGDTTDMQTISRPAIKTASLASLSQTSPV